MSLSTFLQSCKTTLQRSASHLPKLAYAIGNESADLDSCISALSFAFLQDQLKADARFSQCTPVLNMPRADVRLRAELLLLCKSVGLETSSFICRDEIDASSATEWAILDHNHFKVEGIDSSMIKVLAVIDHHVDEHLYPEVQPRIVQPCGSCCSLVVRYFQSSWEEQGLDAESELVPLLLGAILTDTANLTQQMTDVDIEVVKFLRSRIATGTGTKSWNETAILRALRDAKRDNTGLSTAEMLRRDYKEWDLGVAGKWGVSSVTTSMAELAKESDWLQASTRQAEARSLDVHLVMTKHGAKELMCHVANLAKSKWMDKFLSLATPALQLVPWDKQAYSGPQFYTFQQLNTVYTRKKVAILCQEMLQNDATCRAP